MRIKQIQRPLCDNGPVPGGKELNKLSVRIPQSIKITTHNNQNGKMRLNAQTFYGFSRLALR